MLDKKQYLSDYYILNKDRIIAKRKAYYIQNKDKILNYNKIYRHEQCINLKKWYCDNIEQRRKKCREYYYKNKQKFHEYYKTKQDILFGRQKLILENVDNVLYF